MTLKELLCRWFEQKLPTLKHDYNWRIPPIPGFYPKYRTCYENTLLLKEFFRELWNESDEEEKINIARLIIGEWGGIKTNKKTTLEWFVGEIQLEHPMKPETPLNGVSSYSKLYSVIKPEEYMLYDSRIAVGLNCIQINRNIKDGVVFNFISSSRNPIIKEFFAAKEFKPKNLYEKYLWFKPFKDDTYRAYVTLMKSCLKEFPKFKLYDLEMAIFHHSIDECMRVMQNFRANV